jgi:hypothetical protein
MDKVDQLVIGSNQRVVINCNGQRFNYHSKLGNLTVGKGSVLEYRNCELQAYDYPDHGGLWGSEIYLRDTLIGMDSCQVRLFLY